MPQILVTGGCGFIGSNFINYWLQNHPEDKILNLDKMTYASDESYIDRKLIRNNYRFIRGDIADKENVAYSTDGIDTIVNFAAESHVDNSIRDPSLFVKSNYEGVFNLLEATRKHDLRFHQISTDEVYGSLPLHSEEKFDEKSQYNPRNPYSATKAAADFLVRSYFNTYGVKVTLSNCSNNFGPNQHPEKLIPKIILYALAEKKIPVYGNGNHVRDWIYVKDHVRGIEAILEKGGYGETYLLSAENELRNIDLVKRVLEFLGKDESLIEFVKDRPGHDSRYSINPEKTRKELDWRPTLKFQDALSTTITHYVNNLDFYKSKL